MYKRALQILRVRWCSPRRNFPDDGPRTFRLRATARGNPKSHEEVGVGLGTRPYCSGLDEKVSDSLHRQMEGRHVSAFK